MKRFFILLIILISIFSFSKDYYIHSFDKTTSLDIENSIKLINDDNSKLAKIAENVATLNIDKKLFTNSIFFYYKITNYISNGNKDLAYKELYNYIINLEKTELYKELLEIRNLSISIGNNYDVKIYLSENAMNQIIYNYLSIVGLRDKNFLNTGNYIVFDYRDMKTIQCAIDSLLLLKDSAKFLYIYEDKAYEEDIDLDNFENKEYLLKYIEKYINDEYKLAFKDYINSEESSFFNKTNKLFIDLGKVYKEEDKIYLTNIIKKIDKNDELISLLKPLFESLNNNFYDLIKNLVNLYEYENNKTFIKKEYFSFLDTMFNSSFEDTKVKYFDFFNFNFSKLNMNISINNSKENTLYSILKNVKKSENNINFEFTPENFENIKLSTNLSYNNEKLLNNFYIYSTFPEEWYVKTDLFENIYELNSLFDSYISSGKVYINDAFKKIADSISFLSYDGYDFKINIDYDFFKLNIHISKPRDFHYLSDILYDIYF